MWYIVQGQLYKKYQHAIFPEEGLTKKYPFLSFIPKIENKHLLVDDGSLRLKSGIRYKADFEVR